MGKQIIYECETTNCVEVEVSHDGDSVKLYLGHPHGCSLWLESEADIAGISEVLKDFLDLQAKVRGEAQGPAAGDQPS